MQNIALSKKTYDLLQQVKQVFVSYTGEDIDQFSDDKVIEILATGFFDSTDDQSDSCCGGSCHNDDHGYGCCH